MGLQRERERGKKERERERQRERERDFPGKALSQLNADWPIPLLEAERQVGNSQSQKARGNLGPRHSILYQTVSKLPVANQIFLGS